jgi:hypothetical protein
MTKGWTADKIVLALVLLFGISVVVYGVGPAISEGGGANPLSAILVVAVLLVVAYAIYSARHPPRRGGDPFG